MFGASDLHGDSDLRTFKTKAWAAEYNRPVVA